MNPHTVNTDVDQPRLLLWFVSQILAPKVTAHSVGYIQRIRLSFPAESQQLRSTS
jgi:hypothetical protein